MRDYGKVHTSFWTSSNIRELSEDGRALAIYLLTCPHGTIAGVFRLPDGYASEDLQWSPERVQTTLSELFSNGFATRCESTKWVWVTKHFEWNQPENPNQKKAAAKVAAQVPDSCHWKADFIGKCGVHLGIEAEQKANPPGTLQKPFLNQEQEQEQEQDKKEANASVASSKLPTCQTQSVIDLFHEILPELPVVRLLNDPRKKAISSFWKFVLTSKRSDGTARAIDAESALVWVRGYFERTRENDFLMGRGPKAGGHENWTCDIDFLLSDKGKKHVIEKTKDVA